MVGSKLGSVHVVFNSPAPTSFEIEQSLILTRAPLSGQRLVRGSADRPSEHATS